MLMFIPLMCSDYISHCPFSTVHPNQWGDLFYRYLLYKSNKSLCFHLSEIKIYINYRMCVLSPSWCIFL